MKSKKKNAREIAKSLLGKLVIVTHMGGLMVYESINTSPLNDGPKLLPLRTQLTVLGFSKQGHHLEVLTPLGVRYTRIDIDDYVMEVK